MATRPMPGGVAALTAFLAAGVADGIVIATTGDSMTAACRRHPVITTVVVGSFICHLTGRPKRLAMLDPYRAIGYCASRIPR